MVFNKIVYKTDPQVPEVSLRSSDDSLYPNVVHAKPQSVTLHLPTFQVYLISSAGVFCQSLTFTRVFAISSQNSHAIFTIVRNLALSANFVCNYCLGFHSLFVQLNSPEIEAQSLQVYSGVLPPQQGHSVLCFLSFNQFFTSLKTYTFFRWLLGFCKSP